MSNQLNANYFEPKPVQWRRPNKPDAESEMIWKNWAAAYASPMQPSFSYVHNCCRGEIHKENNARSAFELPKLTEPSRHQFRRLIKALHPFAVFAARNDRGSTIRVWAADCDEFPLN